MKMQICYSADADDIGNIIGNLSITELQILDAMVDRAPGLFPTLTIELIHAEANKYPPARYRKRV